MYSRNEFLKKATNADEKLIISKVIDRINLCIKRHEMTFTDFLNPTETAFVYDLIKGITDVNFMIFGGSDECERNMIGFSPEYMEISESDFPIMAIKVKRNIKFSSELSHRDYLGSMLGMGIERDKTGDIFIFDEYTILFVSESISDYIGTNLTKVGRTSVKTEVLPISNVDMPKKNIVEKRSTVSSMRLDAIIGSALNMSRGKAQDYIKAMKVNVNWSLVSSTSHIVKEGDMISVRGKGRFKIGEEGRMTKKDRMGVTFLMYV